MPVVPHRKGVAQGVAQAQGASPPDPMFLMAAATTMHSEGRLLAADQSGVQAKLSSIPESAQSAIRSQ